ncbi:hypothetical protein PIB30_052530 [Stylosanthes scabra]|uniref:Uncharacterized protein n=1 Tax=Stylosanthes scabra TaxID=79078 RepID=A0ABU6ZGZ7_9FABA|nr:hypothetical protein [Stylosanthes scabra]
MEEQGYPLTLDNLSERNALFKINVKLNNIDKDDRVYTVSNIFKDDDLVKQHLADDFTNQSNGTEMGGSNFPEDSDVVANLHNQCRDHLDVPIGEDSISTRAPGKKPMADQTSQPSGIDDAENEGQLSTNKFSMRGVKKGRLQIIDSYC